jgi:HD-GYP domain-containing protein (c-di-GMP phosphodiesterase class II)
VVGVVELMANVSCFDVAVATLPKLLAGCVTSTLSVGFVDIERGSLRVLLSTVDVFRTGVVATRLTEIRRSQPTRLLLVGELSDDELRLARALGLTANLREDVRPDELFIAVEQAFALIAAQANSENHNQRLTRSEYELDELIDVARALTKERDTSRLLGLILERSRFVASADAGSLYVVERSAGESEHECDGRVLHFQLSQNDSLKFDSKEFRMPVNRSSMAGWVVLERIPIRIDDVYELPENSPFAFDCSFDQKTGYRTKSMLCAPLISSQGEVIGVLQLINKKRNPRASLHTRDEVEREVVSFDDRCERLLVTFAAQAGIALENALLYDEIRGLFEGFVRASVDAIEARDPTTSGHSRRVAELTLRLAEAVDRCDTGPYREVHFSNDERRELEYAALLHDFGKIGVRENVLVKEKKLYPYELESIRLRIELLLRELDAERYRREIELRERGASAEALGRLVESCLVQRRELLQAYDVIRTAAEPSVLKAQERAQLTQLERFTLKYADGREQPLLSSTELDCLHIERGSLTRAEVAEIQSHVTHSQRFLSRIPWGTTLRNVPPIAGAHHERLNGTGYPLGLVERQIPLQSKMMSIADIFDALTASDRPYKRAVPLARALDILEMEVRDHHLDGELVRIFREAEVWREGPLAE